VRTFGVPRSALNVRHSAGGRERLALSIFSREKTDHENEDDWKARGRLGEKRKRF
jgi:hypothetical protein